MNERARKKMASCLEQIDFDQIARVMKFINWQWALLGRSPTSAELRDRAISLLEDSWRIGEKSCRLQSGGLSVSWFHYDDGDFDCEVEFHLESADSTSFEDDELSEVQPTVIVSPSNSRGG